MISAMTGVDGRGIQMIIGFHCITVANSFWKVFDESVNRMTIEKATVVETWADTHICAPLKLG